MKFIHSLFIALIFSAAMLLQVQAASSAQASGVPSTPSNIPNGVQCKKSADCESGNCMYGKCQDKQRIGSGCYKDASCETGLCTSNQKSTPGKCVNHESVRRDGKCKVDGQCVDGTFCSTLQGDRCRLTRKKGSSCNRDAVCRSNLCRKRKCT